MASPQMRKWVYHRAKKLLDDLDDVPLSDDSIEKKLIILREGLREASVELFKRAAERATADLLDSSEVELISKPPEKIMSSADLPNMPKFRKI